MPIPAEAGSWTALQVIPLVFTAIGLVVSIVALWNSRAQTKSQAALAVAASYTKLETAWLALISEIHVMQGEVAGRERRGENVTDVKSWLKQVRTEFERAQGEVSTGNEEFIANHSKESRATLMRTSMELERLAKKMELHPASIRRQFVELSAVLDRGKAVKA